MFRQIEGDTSPETASQPPAAVRRGAVVVPVCSVDMPFMSMNSRSDRQKAVTTTESPTMSDSQQSTTGAQDATNPYDTLDDDQWRRRADADAATPSSRTESEPTKPDDVPADAEPVGAQADHAVVLETSTTDSDSVGDALEQTGFKPQTGEPIVANVSGQNGSAALDAQTEDGLGQEFGVWGREFIATGSNSVMPRPAGSGLAAAERMAGEQKELDRINNVHDRFNIADRCHCGGDIIYLSGEFRCDECAEVAADRESIEASATDRAEQNRTAWDVTDGLRTRIVINGDMYDDDFRNQLRGEDALPEDIHLAPSRRQDALANDNHVPRHKVFDHTMVNSPMPIACPWADRENGEKTPTVYPSDLLQLEKDVRKRVHDAEREAAVDELIVGSERLEGILSRLEPNYKWHDCTAEHVDADDVIERPDTSPALTHIRRAAYDALEANNNAPEEALFDILDELYNPRSTCLTEVQPWWSGATTKVKVDKLYTPRSPQTQYQVAEVTPVNPRAGRTAAGSETAKLTIWHRSNIEESHNPPHDMLREGDTVMLKNVKPSQYRNQLTLAFTSDSELIRVNPGTGPATNYTDATSNVEYTPQDRSALGGGSTISQVAVPRYRRPSIINIEDLDFLASSGAQQGPSKKHKDLAHQLMTWQYPLESCPDWFVAEHRSVDDRAFDFEAVRDEPTDTDGQYVQFHRSAFERAVENIEAATGLTFEELPVTTAEYVVEASHGSETIRLYSSVFGEWAADRGTASIRMAHLDANDNIIDIERVYRSIDRTRWDQRLEAKIEQLIA